MGAAHHNTSWASSGGAGQEGYGWGEVWAPLEMTHEHVHEKCLIQIVFLCQSRFATELELVVSASNINEIVRY